MQKIGYFLKSFLYSGVYGLCVGLNKIIKQTDHEHEKSTREAFTKMGLSLAGEKREYPIDFGRIDCNIAYRMACELGESRETSLGSVSGEIKWPRDEEEGSEIDTFRELVQITYKINKIANDRDKSEARKRAALERLANKCWPGDKLLEGLFGFWSKHLPEFDSFYSKRPVRKVFSQLVNLKGEISKQKLLEFLKRTDRPFYEMAGHFIRSFGNAVKEKAHLGDLASRLDTLETRIDEEFHFLGNSGSKDLIDKTNDFSASHNSVFDVMNNEVGCCITGPSGEYRDAAILYCLDRSVNTWSFDCGQDNSTIGLGIFVEATGRHFSKPHGEEKRYLVVEGFPSNDKYYRQVGQLNPNYGRFQIASSFPDDCTLPQLVYFLGLLTAKVRRIPKLFINTEHGSTMPSVEDVVHEAAQATVEKEGFWRFHGRKFELLKDSETKGPFAYLESDGYRFEYTHFLQKSPLLPGLITQLKRLNSDWEGEEFFDTWHGWNKFIIATYPHWSEELKKQHPYAESVWRRGKDPQWNLGIGYCKGFEVDVAKECKRLGIS